MLLLFNFCFCTVVKLCWRNLCIREAKYIHTYTYKKYGYFLPVKKALLGNDLDFNSPVKSKRKQYIRGNNDKIILRE